MIVINLLSKERQREVKKHFLIDFIATILVTLLLLSIFTSVSLLITKALLQNQFNDVVAQAALVTNSFARTNQEIRDANDSIDVLNKLLLKHTSWSKLLTQFVAAIPESVNIKSLLFDRVNNNIAINGFAARRDDLLTFIENLESTDIFEQIESPISNIFMRNNVTFEIHAQFSKILIQ